MRPAGRRAGHAPELGSRRLRARRSRRSAAPTEFETRVIRRGGRCRAGLVQPQPPRGGLGVVHRDVGPLEQRGRVVGMGPARGRSPRNRSPRSPARRGRSAARGPAGSAGRSAAPATRRRSPAAGRRTRPARAGPPCRPVRPRWPAPPTSTRSRSPSWCPRVSLTCEVVEVEDHDGAPQACPPATSSRAVARRRRRCSRFGEAGERVVQGLVAQLTHELAVAQRDAGLVRDGLQQEDVVLVEAAGCPRSGRPRPARRRRRPCRGAARRRRPACRRRPATGAPRGRGCRGP